MGIMKDLQAHDAADLAREHALAEAHDKVADLTVEISQLTRFSEQQASVIAALNEDATRLKARITELEAP